MPLIDPTLTVRQILERRAAEDPDWVYCRFEDRAITVRELDERVNRLANGLLALGIGPGDRVAAMLPNHPDYMAVILALAKLGAVWIPVNVHLRGADLEYLLEAADPRALLVDARYAEQALPALAKRPIGWTVWRGGQPAGRPADADFAAIAGGSPEPPSRCPAPPPTISSRSASPTRPSPRAC